MKKFFLYPFFAMFLSFAGGAFAQTVDTSNPDALVKTVTQQVMDQIKEKNGAIVDEGLQYLTQAVQNKDNYDEAMAYLNLIYRRKADVDFGNASAVKDDIAKAEDWRTKAMGVRKANEEKKNQGPGGITMDANGNLK